MGSSVPINFADLSASKPIGLTRRLVKTHEWQSIVSEWALVNCCTCAFAYNVQSHHGRRARPGGQSKTVQSAFEDFVFGARLVDL